MRRAAVFTGATFIDGGRWWAERRCSAADVARIVGRAHRPTRNIIQRRSALSLALSLTPLSAPTPPPPTRRWPAVAAAVAPLSLDLTSRERERRKRGTGLRFTARLPPCSATLNIDGGRGGVGGDDLVPPPVDSALLIEIPKVPDAASYAFFWIADLRTPLNESLVGRRPLAHACLRTNSGSGWSGVRIRAY